MISHGFNSGQHSQTALTAVVGHPYKKLAHRGFCVLCTHEALLHQQPCHLVNAASTVDECHKKGMDPRRGGLHFKVLQQWYRSISYGEPFGQCVHFGAWRDWLPFLARTPSKHCLEPRMSARRGAHVWDPLFANQRWREPGHSDDFEGLLEGQTPGARALCKNQ